MDYTTLGRAGLKVSVAGLGCGGNSALGLARGNSEADAIAVVRRALDLGINLLDTAKIYGTEVAVGKAIKGRPRDSVVICTKTQAKQGEEAAPLYSTAVAAGAGAAAGAAASGGIRRLRAASCCSTSYRWPC